jgi:hypothetical protein
VVSMVSMWYRWYRWYRWGQTRLILNCSDRLSPPLTAGSTRLFNLL